MALELRSTLIGDTIVRVSGAGAPIVCVHGFTTTAEFWKEQVEEFSRDHLLVRVNLPGHGVSPRPEGRAYTIEAFAADVKKVFDTLSLKDAVLIGLSMGGTVAQRFALDNPSLLRGLVLVGATPHGLGPDVRAENVLRAITELGTAKSSQNVIEKSFGSAASAALVEFAKNEVIQTPDFVAKEAIQSLNESDSRSWLESIVTPTLVVVGEEDVITPPEESRKLAAGIPDADLCVVEKAGHFPMLEQPDAFNRALRRFLAKLRQSVQRDDN
jgi:pimeloyl-ACP methyl ester carboxylesterase